MVDVLCVLQYQKYLVFCHKRRNHFHDYSLNILMQNVVRHSMIVFVDATWTQLYVIIVLQSPHWPAQWYCGSHVYVIDRSTWEQYDTIKTIAIVICDCSDKSCVMITHLTKWAIVQHYKFDKRLPCAVNSDLYLSRSYRRAWLVKKICFV